MLASKSINGLESDFLAEFPMLKFTGDGRFPINDSEGPMFPDFVLPYTDKIIEVWGDYWHEGEIPQDRIDRLARAGYDAIVVWESEFRYSIDKVRVKVLAFLEMRGT